MQISKITPFMGLNHSHFTKRQVNPINLKNQNDIFEKSIGFTGNDNEDKILKYSIDWGYQHFLLPTVSEFDVYYPKQRKLNLLKGNEAHLKDVAESLCMYGNDDIVNFCKIYIPFIRELNKEKSVQAFFRLIPFVIEQREKLANLHQIKDSLERKAKEGNLTPEEANGLKYTNEEIERIDKKCADAKWKYLRSEHLEVDDGSDKSWQID